MLAFALAAYGFAFRDADPVGALNALRRGLVIAQDSGNRAHRVSAWRRFWHDLRPNTATPLSAFDHLTLAIRNYHDSGNTTTIRVPLAILAALFDRLGRYEPAATIAGFAAQSHSPRRRSPRSPPRSPTCAMCSASQTYESLARKGETMTTAAMATYAYDQIDQARTELEHPS